MNRPDLQDQTLSPLHRVRRTDRNDASEPHQARLKRKKRFSSTAIAAPVPGAPKTPSPPSKFAIEHGVDVLELDLAVTKDNQLVVSHNPTLSLANGASHR